MIEADGVADDRVKEVKVRIPLHFHIKLHSMKVLTGKPISDAVTEALDAYFRGQEGSAARASPDHVPIVALDDGFFEET